MKIVINKLTVITPEGRQCRFGVFIPNFEHSYLTSFSSFFIVDFENPFVCWEKLF